MVSLAKRFEKWKSGMGVSKLKIWWVYCVPREACCINLLYLKSIQNLTVYCLLENTTNRRGYPKLFSPLRDSFPFRQKWILWIGIIIMQESTWGFPFWLVCSRLDLIYELRGQLSEMRILSAQ